MIDETLKDLIEDYCGQPIASCRLLAETYPSRLYCLQADRTYVLKVTKQVSLVNQYRSHQRIYERWLSQQETCSFGIPQPYLLDPEGRFILMEYVDGPHLIEWLRRFPAAAVDLFSCAGQSLRQYQDLVDILRSEARDLKTHDSIRNVLRESCGTQIEQHLDRVVQNDRGAIFRDFTPTNVVVNAQRELYLIDIPDVLYQGPRYYDVARFVDTTKVFSLIDKPWISIFRYGHVHRAVQAFLEGYDPEINDSLLKDMQFVHRQEHILFKTRATRLRGIILEGLYKLI